MKYYIGLDGGGTKTKCVLTNESLTPIKECQGGPSNFLIRGTGEVSESILHVLLKVIDDAGIKPPDIESIVIGSTGAGRRTDAELLEKDFIKYADTKGFRVKHFRVESDARIALEGAFSGKPGSILIAGTGSIMFGKDRNGQIHRVGGFGRFIGDEGSGYVLGKRGLIAASKHFDGRGEPTLITEMLGEKFNITDSTKLITEVYKNNFDIASAVPIVINAAGQSDKIALEILNSETDELLLHIKAMIKLLNEENLKLCLIGGTIATENLYSKIFREKMNTRFPNVIIQDPEMPPALGAVLMARNFVSSS